MKIFKQAAALRNYLCRQREAGHKIGFVPTMGALHDGHLSLIRRSPEVAGVTVCSIFVNPVQFNNTEDFKKYPKTIENDILLLEENGCDILFIPDEKEIYPDEASRKKHFDLGYPETILEGQFRPGHFQGVCLVVEKLLKITNPDFLLLGQKDFQQCIIIKRLLQLMDSSTQLIICPITRELSGLAMSSRNSRLTDEERKVAGAIHHNLTWVKERLTGTNFPTLQKKAISELERKGIKVEYLELAKRNTLEIVNEFEGSEELIILTAVFLSNVRLIDNLLIN